MPGMIRFHIAIVSLLFVMGCGGGGGKPVPLDQAINPVDEKGYTDALTKTTSPREAFYIWMAGLRNQTVADAKARDAKVSEKDDPTSRDNPIDVSRGAVIYKQHCIQCHGKNIDGRLLIHQGCVFDQDR